MFIGKRMTCLEFALALRQAANQVLKGLTSLFFPKTQAIIENLRHQKGKILILRTGNIGDIACAIPALSALRADFPQAHLCLLTSPGIRGLPEARDVLDGLGLVDEIITFYSNDLHDWRFCLALLKNLRYRDFDLFFLFPQNYSNLQRTFRDLLFACLLKVKGALGFVIAHSFPGFDLRTLRDYVPPHNEVERLLHLLVRAGINGSRHFTWNLPEPCHRQAEKILQPYLQKGRPFVGFQVFAKAQANQWPLKNFSILGHLLQDTYCPIFILFGGPAERERLLRLAESFSGDKLVVAGQVSVLETAALLGRCQVMVTMDTGPMHLAALVGTPIVALFSARQFPKMWEPHSENAVILRKAVPCELCFQKKCDHLTCMQAIASEEVYEEVCKFLRQ